MFVDVKVVEGVLDDDEKQQIVEGIADLTVKVEGKSRDDFRCSTAR